MLLTLLKIIGLMIGFSVTFIAGFTAGVLWLGMPLLKVINKFVNDPRKTQPYVAPKIKHNADYMAKEGNA